MLAETLAVRDVQVAIDSHELQEVEDVVCDGSNFRCCLNGEKVSGPGMITYADGYVRVNGWIRRGPAEHRDKRVEISVRERATCGTCLIFAD